jgi:hypothetical protein
VKGHPDHDAVAEVVRGWYTSSSPEIGITAIHEDFGFLCNSDRAAFRRPVLTVNDPGLVEEALRAAAEFYGGSDFEVWVDDRLRAERLDAGLSALGVHKCRDTVVLALVGAVRAEAGPRGLIIEEVVDSEGLVDWARVKLQGFADGEELPPPDRLREEVEGWQREWPVCRYRLGRLEGEAVNIPSVLPTRSIGTGATVVWLTGRDSERCLGPPPPGTFWWIIYNLVIY